MFANRLIRNIFIFILPFVLTVNVYYWTTAVSAGGHFQYVGFYAFFKNFEKMPHWEFLVDSVEKIADIVMNWTTNKGILAVITLGISFIAELLYGIGQMLVCLLIDLIRVFIWLLGFFGVDFVNGGVVQPV